VEAFDLVRYEASKLVEEDIVFSKDEKEVEFDLASKISHDQ